MALNLASCFSSCALPSSIQTKPTFLHILSLLWGLQQEGRDRDRQPEGGRDAGAVSCCRDTSVHNGTAEPRVWVKGWKTEGKCALQLSSACSLYTFTTAGE